MPNQTVPGRRSTSRRSGPRRSARRDGTDTAGSPAPGRADGPQGPVTVRVHPRPGLLGSRLRLQQLVLVEVAVALVAVGWTISRPVAAGFGAVALALVALALVPLRGRTLPDALRVRAALKARRKRARTHLPPPGTDPALAPALELEPALRTCTHATEADLGGRPVRRETGMVGDGTFLSAVLLVQAKDLPLRPDRTARPLPLDVVCSALRVDDIVLESVQLVQHTQPAPAPHLPEQSLAARAYRELADGTATPALRLTWVALKLDPERAATAVRARGGGETGARKALQRVTDQLAGRLNSAGFDVTVLDERELIAALAISTCVNPLATTVRQGTGSGGGSGRRTQESNRFWRVDDRWHSTYWISRWPQLGRPGGAPGRIAVPDLVNLVTGAPALASTFSLTAGHGTGGSVTLSGHVRVTERSESEAVELGRQLEARAQSAGLGLVRLDLEQAPGVLATLPLGGAS
ncbi:type VII secretion protein EccE [Kitasatospora purpeofusca]|uniref:type VII secretion protein EccE n=1 Tax=Kitasatospora purpeofusca TaxID=67352 RepID=UPI00225122AA|nr:type VII secretion protein EccE [Kitasatospora purpeofusca]MCX4757774.1 type VII secretion protein EccE [Kitasatospora purpeofusca]WSR34527.1 type VII secretion protein EccE [Kitasatospora purpeofusca]